ncbi:unnamed protein product [Penicillium egyptiacum]|uniref:Mid2 domain-containing protein n=1 Tax=Penicillium egyptiacum TaxID=1303716 RepID=A0A9W4K3T9_9EURO|nr:unnamed protein product [Penicillium egyptiacum]
MSASSSFRDIILFLCLAIVPGSNGADCYFPDGSLVPNDEYTPCQNGTLFSMCCRTGGMIPDTCQPSGLCYNKCDHQHRSGCKNDPGTFWREACTDQAWQSPYCLQNVCTDPSMNGRANYSVPITQCSRDSKWCCGAIDSQECCDTDMRFELATKLGQSPSSSPTTATISGTSTSSNQTPAETSTDKLSSSIGDGGVDQGLGQGAKIGLGVGIGLGIPVVCGIAAAMFLRWRRKRSPPVVGLHRGEGNFAKPEIGGTSVAELDNRALARELEGTVVMAEMGTEEPRK